MSESSSIYDFYISSREKVLARKAALTAQRRELDKRIEDINRVIEGFDREIEHLQPIVADEQLGAAVQTAVSTPVISPEADNAQAA